MEEGWKDYLGRIEAVRSTLNDPDQEVYSTHTNGEWLPSIGPTFHPCVIANSLRLFYLFLLRWLIVCHVSKLYPLLQHKHTPLSLWLIIVWHMPAGLTKATFLSNFHNSSSSLSFNSYPKFFILYLPLIPFLKF